MPVVKALERTAICNHGSKEHRYCSISDPSKNLVSIQLILTKQQEVATHSFHIAANQSWELRGIVEYLVEDRAVEVDPS